MFENYTWDEDKNISNFKKHGVTFQEARTVFGDKNVIYLADDKHSGEEERFIVIGKSANSRLLVVCHCYRENDMVIRLISAWKANRTEANLYRKGGT
jgi:hypothetical protein